MNTKTHIILTGSALALMLNTAWSEDQSKVGPPDGPKGHFEAMDLNKDGQISKDEFLTQFDAIDANKDGFLSKEELRAHMEKMGKQMHERRGEHGPAKRPNFEEQDLNKDGFLSKEEFKGPDGAFSKIDANNDGQLTKEELSAAKEKMQKFMESRKENKDK